MSKVKGRLTKVVKKAITEKVIAEFKKDIEETEKDIGTFALKLNDALMGDHREAINSLPAQFVQQACYMTVALTDDLKETLVSDHNFHKWNNSISLTFQENVRTVQHGFTVDVPKDLVKEFEEVVLANKVAELNKDKASNRLYSLLCQCTTIKSLLESWPEAVDYLPDAEQKLNNPPAVQSQELNALLNGVKKAA